jgi:hypothetical protein
MGTYESQIPTPHHPAGGHGRPADGFEFAQQDWRWWPRSCSTHEPRNYPPSDHLLRRFRRLPIVDHFGGGC